MRIGNGFDVHQLVEGRPLILGGITVPHHKGLLGHSDADVITHAIMDAILGALNLGDIGRHFPDTDPQYKDADSIELLKKVHMLMDKKHMQIGNIDSVIMAQAPKLKSVLPQISENIAKALQTEAGNVCVKATTTETLGFVGREEGMAASAVVLLTPKTR